MSPRRSAPFVAVDSSAIPEGLLESELFGHRRGAFTGAAHDKPGIIDHADGGTLFLDEVGNLSLQVQAKLLRFLQERRYRRVGEISERSVDVRLVSATNQSLRDLVARGAFREDLYYRLSVITLDIPSLKERPEDIPPLVYHFIRTFNAVSSYRVEGIRRDAMEALVSFAWPGNVRQLENVLERAVILRKAGLIQPADLPEEIVDASRHEQPSGRSLDDVERALILDLLAEHGGNQSRVARILGINRRTVYRKLKSWGMLTGEEEEE
jgi:transcriptional regulator with PAS, ATPase and Fis domain